MLRVGRYQAWLAIAVTATVVATSVVVVARHGTAGRTLGSGASQVAGGAGAGAGGAATGAGMAGAGASAQPGGSGGSAGSSGPGSGVVARTPDPERLRQFHPPATIVPLSDLDPGLATRGPRPTIDQLLRYQYGNPIVIFNARATTDDWQLHKPDMKAVRGYADSISVLPGQSLKVRLNGRDPSAQLDVFRMGLGDATHLLTVPKVKVVPRPEATPTAAMGTVEENWPVSTTIAIPKTWRTGVYLIKLTGSSGGQSYIPFIVRVPKAQPLVVVLPTMTWQAYNLYGGANLYGWTDGPRLRAYQISYDRPFDHAYGGSLFFRLDFPLVVWLEDHGYSPGYVADVDVARDPSLILGAKTVLFSGHGEYWTGGMRAAADKAAGRGVGLGFMGANQAFWQVRLAADGAGAAGRDIICYKSATLDPQTVLDPRAATARFEDPPVSAPPADLMGLQYGGVVTGITPMTVGKGITTFAPDLGLSPGQQLPGLVADEVDSLDPDFDGILLGASVVSVTEHPGTITAAAGLWISPSGNHVFDAGTFDWSWGLDPRYAAALPGFPAVAYSGLMQRILAWLGAQPTI
jgi:hypothetical protein